MKYTNTSARLPGAMLLHACATRKLSPVDLLDVDGIRKRPMPRAPYVSATYVSIEATCPDTCVFKGNGCFAQSGYIKRFTAELDKQAREIEVGSVIANEARLIRAAFPKAGRVPQDGARGGRDLRLHIGGDVSSAKDAALLAEAAETWRLRGGGAVWTYTHRWREIPVTMWGKINAWASVETTEAAMEAISKGYKAAITEPYQQSMTTMRKRLRVVPCPWETRSIPCSSCRLCLDAKLAETTAIGFSIHGVDHEKQEAVRAWNEARQLRQVSFTG